MAVLNVCKENAVLHVETRISPFEKNASACPTFHAVRRKRRLLDTYTWHNVGEETTGHQSIAVYMASAK